MTEKSKDRLLRKLIVASSVLILCSLVINITSPSPRSLWWLLSELMGFLGVIIILGSLFYWAKPKTE